MSRLSSAVTQATQLDPTTRIPPGWSKNPSAWEERLPVLGLALLGICLALYIGLTQIGALPMIWDPLFGSASAYAVTHSAISRLLPIPDGFLGVIGYAGDLLTGALGGDKRWRRRPWLTLLFGVVITALAAVGVALTVLQATVIGHWCSVCLLSALASALIFGLGIREPLATVQLLNRTLHAHGLESVWTTVWSGI